MDIILQLLHLLALALLVRMLIPARANFLNPYAAPLDRLLLRLVGFVQTGLPLPTRGVYAFLFLLTLLGRAACLATNGDARLLLAGPFMLATFPSATALDWMLLQAFHFAFFLFTLYAAITLLRLWHLLKPMPSFVAELLLIGGYPFCRLRVRTQLLTLLLLGTLLFAGVNACAATIDYPFNLLAIPADMPKAQLELIQSFIDLSTLPTLLRCITFSLLGIISALLPLTDAYLMLFWLFLITFLFKNPLTTAFISGALDLLRGRIPTLRIGFINLTALLIFLLIFPFLYALLSTLIIFLSKGLLYVV